MQPNPIRASDMLEQLKAQVEGLERILPELRARMDGTDKEYAKWREAAIHKICVAITTFDVNDNPTKAVAIVSRLHQDCQKLLAPERQLEQYEVLRRQLNSMLVEARHRQEAEQEAQRLRDEQERRWRRTG